MIVNEARPEGMAVGFDIGGTKTNVLRNGEEAVARYQTTGFPDAYSLVDTYLREHEVQPDVICVGMGAVRRPGGDMQFAQCGWPVFRPSEAERRYPGTTFITANDLIATAVGVFEQDTGYTRVKSGMSVEEGASLVYAWSTGIGGALAVRARDGYRYISSACGHVGLAPQYEDEIEYLHFVSRRNLGKLSLEFAIGGKHGIDTLVDYCYQRDSEVLGGLYERIQLTRSANIPTGRVLVELALDDNPLQMAAKGVLNRLGGLMGYALRNQLLSVVVDSIKMTGSLSLGLVPYLADHTPLIERFVDKNARCAYIPDNVAIDIITDPHVAVKGSLALAQKELHGAT